MIQNENKLTINGFLLTNNTKREKRNKSVSASRNEDSWMPASFNYSECLQAPVHFENSLKQWGHFLWAVCGFTIFFVFCPLSKAPV